jgi:hypothetical protein
MRFILIICLSILSFSGQLLACGCIQILSAEESHRIFQARVLKVEKIESPFIRYEITLKVTKRIKGKFETKRIIINTPCLEDGCCGIDFKVWRKFEVYTYIDQQKIEYTDLCTLTKKIRY